jgi:hypothetical protein
LLVISLILLCLLLAKSVLFDSVDVGNKFLPKIGKNFYQAIRCRTEQDIILWYPQDHWSILKSLPGVLNQRHMNDGYTLTLYRKTHLKIFSHTCTQNIIGFPIRNFYAFLL